MTDNINVQWQSPPSARKERTAWFAQLAQELRRHPGKWAVAEQGLTDYRTQAAVMASRINSGQVSAFQPEGAFESTSAKDGRVFVRYVGESGEYKDLGRHGVVWETPGTATPSIEPTLEEASQGMTSA